MKFSIIIPFKEPTEYLYECLDKIQKQTYKDYEVILLPDVFFVMLNSFQHLKKIPKQVRDDDKRVYQKIKVIPTGNIGPAEKRDLGVKKAKGEILAFIDDDAYPDKNWLRSTLEYFKNSEISAVCGPGLTPVSDDIFQQAGGWVNSLWFGSGGAGNYRFTPQKRRLVDDYPSMNFFVRKEDFEKIGGFDTHFWPGEDTKLCHDLVYNLKKQIIYDPKVLVYHHRKPLFLPHLKQISRYAFHRGHFAKILPKTSFRVGYLIPSFFVIFLLVGFFMFLIIPEFRFFYLSVLLLYLILLTGNIFYVMSKTRSILIAVLTGCGILLTHVIYGLLFPIGFLKKSLRQ